MRLKAVPAMLAMIPSVIKGVGPRDLERIKKIIRKSFPSVNQISIQTLENWLAAPNPLLLLVDVRKPAEFAVSHLRDAVNLRSVAEIKKAIAERKPTRTVLYCSVGFRSSQVAARIPNATAKNVFNLEGSIFDWANQGFPIFQKDVPKRQVHPYSKQWAGLLKEGLAAT